MHRRHRAGICRCIVVAHDCMIPARHEANVTIHMENDGIPLPPSDWAVEPQGLGPGVMATRTLFSNSQSQLVARVLNNSLKPKSLRANSLLSMAEPVQCIFGSSSSELSNFLFADSGDSSDFALRDESAMPVSSSLRSQRRRLRRLDSALRLSLRQQPVRQTLTHRLPFREMNRITSTVCCIVFLRI